MRTWERALISFLVMTVFGVIQLHFIMSHPRHYHPTPCPFSSKPGILWVRDPDDCSSYYICVGSQAFRMPPCPGSTVWSVKGRNCVPRHSSWDDCHYVRRVTQHRHVHVSGPSRSHAPAHRHVSAAPPPSLSPSPATRSETYWSDSADVQHTQATAASLGEMGNDTDSRDPERELKQLLKRIQPNHPCASTKGKETYLPHPDRCHWFYNCSAIPTTDDLQKGWEVEKDGWDLLTDECPYPSLFSTTSLDCQPYTTVDCATRGLFLDPCEYRHLNCRDPNCPPCSQYGSCIGKNDGLQAFTGREWTPHHIECKDQRVIQQLDCPQNKPIFSQETRRCENLLDIPKQHGGHQPSCLGRHDGRYPDDTGLCDMFYACSGHVIQSRFQCPSGTAFHPQKQACRGKHARGLPYPCSHNSTAGRTKFRLSQFLCRGMEDGMYADPYGRCPLYYECQKSSLKKYHKCNFGSFNPRSHDCQFSVSKVPAPCGQLPNPCMDQVDGHYADLASNCQASFRCKQNVVVRQASCPPGKVFHEGKKSCQLPNHTPPPCGLAPSCAGRPDGRYPSPLRGCQFYFTCTGGIFRGYSRCSIKDGGFYFNGVTGKCDFPQNICPPCGIRANNCTVSSVQY